MKTYQELTPAEQAAACERCLANLLEAIIEGGLRFNDALNGDGLQARIDAAGELANAMQTPWFWHEYILDTCREDLEGMAYCNAEDSLYSAPGERCLAGIAA